MMVSHTQSQIDYARKRVLVVDDFPQHLQFMRKSLESIGFESIDLVQNAEEAISRCAEHPFDLVFCDYNLGTGKNGPQLLMELRHLKYVSFNTSFILITAETSRDMVLAAVEAQPEAYIVKPLNEGVLRRKIDRLLEQKNQLRQINNHLANDELPEAAALCEILAVNKPKYRSWCYQKLGQIYLETDDLDKAEHAYRQVLDLRVVEWALIGLAKVHLRKRDYLSVSTVLENALALNRNSVAALDLMARCALEQCDIALAELQLLKATELAPRSVARQQRLGRVAEMNGRYPLATKSFRAAIRSERHSLFENDQNALFLASSLTDSMSGDLGSSDKALALEIESILGRVIEKSSHIPQVNKICGAIKLRLGLNQQGAMAELEGVDAKELRTGNISHWQDQLFSEYLKSALRAGDEETVDALTESLIGREDLPLELKVQLSQVKKTSNNKLLAQITRLNEQGTECYEAGQLERSVELLSKAAALSPSSKAINLNLIQAQIRRLETGPLGKYGDDELGDIQARLDDLGEILPESRYFPRLQNLSERLQAIVGHRA